LEADPNRPKSATPNQGDYVQFDFEKTPLIDVVKSLGAQTGRNFQIKDGVTSTPVTVFTYSPIPAELAFAILENILVANGLGMVEALDGNMIMIVPIGTGVTEGSEKVPMFIGSEKFPQGYDNFETRVIPVRYASAEDLQELMRGLGSPNADVKVYGPTNLLILTDVAGGLRRMLTLLREIDIPGYDIVTRIFQLEYARAEIVATQLQDVLIGPDGQQATPGRAGGRPVAAPQPNRRVLPNQGRQQGVVVGSVAETLRVVHDERLNTVITVANESMMERVEDLIARLDQPVDTTRNNMHIYDLLNADAVKIAEALNGIISGTTSRAESQGAGAAQSGEIQTFEKTVTVTAYEETNALLVLATPQDYEVLKVIIAGLDVLQRQVNIEAIIMDVVIDDAFSLSVNSVGIDDDSFFGFSNAATLANAIVAGPFGLAGTGGGTIGYVDGTSDLPVPDGTGGFTTTTVPNIPVLLTMIETLTSVDILSQPSLTTKDNVEANIIVGQEVPFITGSQSSLAGGGAVGGGSLFSRVSREDVGIKLKVTPQISEGDTVSMQLDVEVSQTVASDVGADVNLVGPTLSKSNVTGEILVRDGSTAIIGGLVSEQTNRSISQTPILGDLPIIGMLFRSKGTGRAKRNLVVLVSPNIVRDATDAERLTEHKLTTFSRANMDAWFEHGFLEKVSQKYESRKIRGHKFRGLDRNNAGPRFQRGDIKR
jgi:general secretion pathway protein D